MSTEQVGRKELEAAADWWAQVLLRPKFDNGDESESGVLTQVLATTNALRKPIPTDDQLAIFKEKLIEASERDERRDRLWLSVDYGPCLELNHAATEAGISLSLFPWKTRMHITPGLVKVAYGYSAPYQCIYGEEADAQA